LIGKFQIFLASTIPHRLGDHPTGSAAVADIRTMLSEMRQESDEVLAHLLDVITRPNKAAGSTELRSNSTAPPRSSISRNMPRIAAAVTPRLEAFCSMTREQFRRRSLAWSNASDMN
jgi:hypothetical protein